MKKRKFILTIFVICLILALGGCSDETKDRLGRLTGRFFSPSKLSSAESLNLRSDDGVNYYFTYDDEDYYAEYLDDTWKIYNSYKIKNSRDILTICKALSEEHQVPSRDRESYRTPKDMAFEWEQHNVAYDELPEGNYWRECSRNVDLDPDDQGKTFKEIYEERTGNKLDLDTVMEHKSQIKEKVKEKLGGDDAGFDIDNIDFDKFHFDSSTYDRIKEKLKEKIKEKLNDE